MFCPCGSCIFCVGRINIHVKLILTFVFALFRRPVQGEQGELQPVEGGGRGSEEEAEEDWENQGRAG